MVSISEISQDGSWLLGSRLAKRNMVGTRHVCKTTGLVGIVTGYLNGYDSVVIDFNGIPVVRETKSVIRRGVISLQSKLVPSLFGVGYIGIGKYSSSDGNGHSLSYLHFKEMMRRCYSQGNSKAPSTVCEEWHNFQNFSDWFYTQIGSIVVHQNMALDKDLLGNGTKVYSPTTCCLLPVELNSLGSLDVHRIDTSMCISKRGDKYLVRFSPYRSKTTKTILAASFDEALNTLLTLKSQKMSTLADEYKQYLSKEAYFALKTYKERVYEALSSRE